MRAVMIKEFRELARDRRTLAMLVAMPIVLLIIFGYAANFAVDKITVLVVQPPAFQVAADIRDLDVGRDDIDVLPYRSDLSAAEGEEILRAQEVDAVIVALPNKDANDPLGERIHVLVDGSQLFTAQAAQGIIAQLVAEDARERISEAVENLDEATAEAKAAEAEMDDFASQMEQYQDRVQEALETGAPPPAPPQPPDGVELPDFPEITTPTLDPDELVTVLFNPDLKTSWVMVPGLIGLILLFIGALITSIGLVRERETGTLEQLAVMPLRPSAIILGKIVPYFLLALLDIGIVTALGVWMFDVPFVGSLWIFALAAVVFLFVVLGIGVFISSVSATTGQAIQMAILFVVPQVLLSGLIFPLSSMPLVIRWIGYGLPLTWFREIAQGVMLRDAGFTSLWIPFVVLTGMAVFAFGAATARMRYSLTHGGAR